MNYDQWKSTEPDDSDTRYFRNWQSAEAWAKRRKNRLQDYEIRHDAMALLWSIIDQTEEPLRTRIASAISYLRRAAYDSLPWPADVLPNKGWDGKRT